LWTDSYLRVVFTDLLRTISQRSFGMSVQPQKVEAVLFEVSEGHSNALGCRYTLYMDEEIEK
jgi:hypothetical protein